MLVPFASSWATQHHCDPTEVGQMASQITLTRPLEQLRPHNTQHEAQPFQVLVIGALQANHVSDDTCDMTRSFFIYYYGIFLLYIP